MSEASVSDIWNDVQSAVQDAIIDSSADLVSAHYLEHSFRVDGLHVSRADEHAALVAERDALKKALKETSDALLKVRPLGGSELFRKVAGGQYADPVFCGQCIDEMLAEQHQSRRREALAAKAARSALTQGASS